MAHTATLRDTIQESEYCRNAVPTPPSPLVICGNTLKEPVIFQTADAYCRRSYLSLSIDWVIKSATKEQRGI